MTPIGNNGIPTTAQNITRPRYFPRKILTMFVIQRPKMTSASAAMVKKIPMITMTIIRVKPFNFFMVSFFSGLW